MSEKPGWRERMFGGFKKTSSKLTDNLAGLVTKSKLDTDTLDAIEEALCTGDALVRPFHAVFGWGSKQHHNTCDI